jgi:hypothetical protein
MARDKGALMTDTIIPPVSADNPGDIDRTAIRAAPSLATKFRNLGLLAEFPGHWIGRGFNLIARPDREHGDPFFLELNPTKETLDFTSIGGAIPNRGSLEKDINLFGVHYLQQVSDARHGTGIHIEPGLWVRVPPTVNPPVVDDTYVRQSVIPHGDSVLAQSVLATAIPGGPRIDPVDSIPFTGEIPDLNTPSLSPLTGAKYLVPYRRRPLPRTMDQTVDASDRIRNPALLLLDDIKGQTISETVVISVSTAATDFGVLNIPFVTQNANAARLDAIFWIETVQDPRAGEIMQMQYVQRVILDFDGIHWPHISVATLRKQ